MATGKGERREQSKVKERRVYVGAHGSCGLRSMSYMAKAEHFWTANATG